MASTKQKVTRAASRSANPSKRFATQDKADNQKFLYVVILATLALVGLMYMIYAA